MKMHRISQRRKHKICMGFPLNLSDHYDVLPGVGSLNTLNAFNRREHIMHPSSPYMVLSELDRVNEFRLKITCTLNDSR